MATVTGEIRRLMRARDQKILDGQKALRGLLEEVKKEIIGELSSIRGESYTSLYLKRNLASIERYLAAFETAGAAEMDRLLDTAWELGEDVVPAALRTASIGAAFGHIPGSLLIVMKDFSYHRIRGVTSAAFDRIRGELSLGVLGQKTPNQVIDAIAGTLQSKGVFDSIEERAAVITKVEMGRAYSQATQTGMDTAAASVPELKKQWWHAGHPQRPRKSHLALHGQIRRVNEPFVTGSLAIDFPRSPKAPASEVIRCGCDHLPWHPAWSKEMEKLPIYDERGHVIARRSERSGTDADLTGKFIQGQISR